MKHQSLISWVGLALLVGLLTGCRSNREARELDTDPVLGFSQKYCYYYYPSSTVYYDVRRGLYFFAEQQGWLAAVRLPDYVKLNWHEAVCIESALDRPYLELQSHWMRYPPGESVRVCRVDGRRAF